ncbi:hypothetical protein HKB31_10720 [Vibrio alginolyticus]|jgi:putative phage-type endonuclease|uniref:lambda-exonuclease family protein n=1 Tax=Vibrio TaxID=662 RepID=UPI00112491A0|nr:MULTISPECIES: YqaJ viral recombinase family protein [Vibrio]MDW2302519.1 YqaJ viral recombinase family protein [Vibrio sp. 1167]NMT94239.1 hypothetical protein [Vibrio alginolyticus]TOP86691.1 hypothetical protein CGH07_22765 [Vibrio parahaemolyticus]HCG6133644.1 YqaJ viral recombinase family protein [Vibrio parahaemolyticus]
MPVVDIVQRSEKWFEWRKQGITASMIPVIMGLSPYQTPYQLWAELVGLKEPDDLSKNYHVQRGVEQEPEAREAVENEYGKPYMPVCVEADHEHLFRASLDGLYILGSDKEVLEIKCPCEKIYNEILAMQGQAPTFQMYAAQVQWQLNCSGADIGRLYFYLRGKRPISTRIRRNDAFIKKAEKAAIDFWKRVQSNTPPEMIEGRDKVVYDTPISNQDNSWQERVEQYKEKSARHAELVRQCDAVKADLKQLESYFTEQIPSDVQTFNKDGIRATRVDKTGNVNYQNLLAEIEDTMNVVIPSSLIEKHRNKGSTYFRVTIQEESSNQADVPIEQYQPKVEAEQPKQEATPLSVTPAEQAVPSSLISDVETHTEPEEPTPITAPIKPLAPGNFFEKSAQNHYF